MAYIDIIFLLLGITNMGYGIIKISSNDDNIPIGVLCLLIGILLVASILVGLI